MGEVTTLKKSNGEVLHIIDGMYVIGAGGACEVVDRPCRTRKKVIDGMYLAETCCKFIFDEYYYDDEKTTLYIPNLETTTLDPDIGCYVDLEMLVIESEVLESLPPEIGNLSGLEKLGIRSEVLESLPSEIGNLSNLKELYAYNNNLESLPSEIGNLSNLEYLYLNNNNLESLPKEMKNLTNLTSVYLKDNNFTDDYKDYIKDDLLSFVQHLVL